MLMIRGEAFGEKKKLYGSSHTVRHALGLQFSLNLTTHLQYGLL